MVRFLEQPSHAALPELLRAKERFDLVFLDGSHLFDYALVDFFYCDQMLRSGGFRVLDDTWMAPVAKLLAYVLTNRSYELEASNSPASGGAWRRSTRLTRTLIRRPSALLEPRALVCSAARAGGFHVLRKRADDDRPWDHYAVF